MLTRDEIKPQKSNPNVALISLMKDLKESKPERVKSDGRRPIFYTRKEVEKKKVDELNQKIKEKTEEVV